MAEPEVSLDTALEQVAPAWDEARTERTLQGLQHKQARRRKLTVAASAAALLVVLGGAFAALRSPSTAAPVAVLEVKAPAERAVRFADGSEAVLLDPAADVVVQSASDSAIDVLLASGRARFEVSQRKGRVFRVLCDDVVVRVLGTGFELIRDGARTHVHVLHGRVAVSWLGGSTELGAGEQGWYPAEPEQTAAPVNEAELARKAPERERARDNDSHGDNERASSWRQHAEQGEFQEAYRVLERERAHVSDDVEELLLAADAARLSGHASAAVPFLQRVVDRHAQDPRAPLAAFTLGGVLMNQLGRPREAEASYARARAMSPSSALSQDALARQVEAAHRASDAAAARALALEYLEHYPNGRRTQAVRRFGGLP